MTAVRETGLAFMAALWAGDVHAVDALLAPGAVWRFQLGMPQATTGPGRVWPARDAVRSILSGLFTRFDPDGFAVAVTRAICEGETLAIEYEARGRTLTGRSYRNYYVTVLKIVDGLVVEVSPYNDTAHMFAMLEGDV